MALPSPLNQIAGHARWLYPLVVLAAAILLGNVFGLGLALLIVAGGVLGGVIWLVWSSLQGLVGDLPITLDEALLLGAPSAEEEQKRAVLRALKDLEYERAVGKINEEDYTNLSEHYKGEAKRLLRAVDAELTPERERAERLLAERLSASEATQASDETRAAEASPEQGASDHSPEPGAPDGKQPEAKTSAKDAAEAGADALEAGEARGR